MYDYLAGAVRRTGGSIKNRDDKRFRRTMARINQAIDEMIANNNIKTQVCDFSKYVGIYASTFYRHYTNIPEAIASRDQAVYDDLKKCVSSKNLRITFYRLFAYLGDNQLYFKNAGRRLNLAMLKIFATENLQPIVLMRWSKNTESPSSKADNQLTSRIYRAYCFELLHEYYEWAFVENFSNRLVDKHIKYLLYLTDTACHRLNYCV